MSEEASNKRQRVSKACEQCRRKKVKCDGTIPVCGNCVSLSLGCTYKESTKKRGPPKGYIEAIEGRLHRLEALLGSIIQEDDPRSQAILAELNAPLETAYGELVRPRPMRRTMTLGYEEGQVEPYPDHHTHSNNHRHQSTDPPSSSSSTATPSNFGGAETANDNLGNLSIDESGQLRYYGKSSGYYMLRSSKNFQNGAFHFNSRGYRARAENRKPSGYPMAVDPFEMPPDDLSQHLLDLYFAHFYPLVPLLHKKSFLEAFKSKDRKPAPLLLNSIYAVASRISPDIRVRADPNLPDTAGDLFFERARILLDLEWDDFKVSTVQSLLLLSSHQNGALKNIRGWLYSGLALRMGQNLGLNRNCNDWDLSATEKEERKRLFYCCFVLDRLTCGMHGRAPMIDERDYDTPYPTEDDEDDVGHSPRIIENFTQLIKLCELLGAVLRDLYTVKGRKQLSVMASPDSVISSLDRGLNKWMAKLPQNCQYRPPNSRLNEKAPAPSLELCQVHMLFYTTLILLHRPFIPGPTQSTSPSVFPSASICSFAANKILDIVESLMAEGRLKNVNNYSLYFMFTAGIIFINDAASDDSMFAFEAKISINKIIRAMDEIEATWITSARHCNILGELAGLRDINLEAVDDSYIRQSERIKVQAPMSIAVPNSPDTIPDAIPDIIEELRHPIDVDRRMTLKQPGYLAVNYNSNITSVQSVSSEESGMPSYPPLTQPQSQSQSQSQFDYPQLPPMSFSDNNGQSSRPFDQVGTAFWGMPTSFDFDEWNDYFSHRNQQQARADANLSGPALSQPMNQPLNQPDMSQTFNGVRPDRSDIRQMW
ncbi:Zn(2)-C6 fungal-specific transcription factor [Phycomyces blakesleeanus]|uniref:Zn(2)-C6 fungal-specific transcription factor n=2 Tax=Phycomyces blakesleeanus TaxID=4837 RepID=A0A162V8I0_PHYB8|nr:Zn(2)-C6 fungal-specific transcription factor [Phycomyces blakesleeanus NRRL 1555(-)]OAD80792.1 Zn(2)-C6 fungal-specific transcription factor [Phycomyces blakesleeanus NRRL 1555(-)]|eukprot:XP_018298832.1 Zn(2)-C6 fungal-specific transcription factor [Phycomyces blakesleeanus NRRL 1555(-)]